MLAAAFVSNASLIVDVAVGERSLLRAIDLPREWLDRTDDLNVCRNVQALRGAASPLAGDSSGRLDTAERRSLSWFGLGGFPVQSCATGVNRGFRLPSGRRFREAPTGIRGGHAPTDSRRWNALGNNRRV
jgi:hypothetical protein